MKNKHIGVLLGGFNSEREVSLKSGQGVYEALISLGYKATKIDFSPNIADDLKEIKPDIIFNALHGQYGEDGSIQGLLDILKIPYTHSHLLASAICMDKILTHKICNSALVKSPEFEILRKGDDLENQKKLAKIGKPFVIKPINEGSSVGVEVILSEMDFDFGKYSWQFGDEIILEKYLAGTEVQVAVFNNRALGAIEVRPKKLFYDYECKYTAGMTNYIMPAEISKEKYEEVLDLALKCYNACGCKDLSRIDFILNNKNGGDNNFYLLEVNTHPGLTPTSLVPKIAAYTGISFAELVEFLIKNASCR